MHRSRIADTLGVKYRVDVVRVREEDEAREIQRTLNADRRQLSEAQRREIATDLFSKGHSETAVAAVLGVSQPTAHRLKDELIHVNKLDLPERIVGLDGKFRPARRPAVVATLNAGEAARAQRALLDLGDQMPFDEDMTVPRAARQGLTLRRTVAGLGS